MGTDMNAPQNPRLRSTTDLSPAIAHALSEFTRAQADWAESTTQDAIESVARIPWLHQVRTGVRVPIHVLYTHSARRIAEREAFRFIEEHAGDVGRMLHVPVHTIRTSARDILHARQASHAAPDPLIRRNWTESEVPWRLRFERRVRSEIRALGTRPLQDWLEATLLAVVAAWDHTARRRLVPRLVIQ